MKPEAEPYVVPLVKKSPTVGDDRYLAEMTERLRKLQALMGEQETRKGRPKRWLGRVESSPKF